jgi:hypothetical protein
MTISYAHDFTDVSSCDNTSASGTHYRLNGVNQGNPLAEGDAYVQGSGCIANKCGATVGATDTGGHFNSTATFDLTNKHLFVWRLISTAGNMLTKANAGVSIGLTNTSTTSTSAWSTTNYKRWNVDGSDTQPNSEGWKCYVIDPSGTADDSAGTLTLSSIKNVGYLCRQNTSISTALNNVFVDAIRMGTGFTVTASSAADTINLAGLFTYDSTKTNAWGVVTQNSGIYYGAGKITIGSTSQTNACNFSDTDQVLVWRKYPVSATLYEFKLQGAAGSKTTMTLDGCVVRGQNLQTWNVTCDTNSDFKALGCAFANLRTAVLSGGSLLSGCAIGQSGTITTNGASIGSCDFALHTATQLVVASPSEMSNIAACTFASAGTGHAIELSAVGTYTFNALTFSGYAGSNGSTGNETVYVSATSGSVTINSESSISVRTAGATVNVVSGQKTKTFTGLPVGTEVRIRQGSYTLAQQQDVNTGSYGYSYTPTSKPARAQFTLPGYVFEDIAITLDGTDQSFPVTWAPDPSYTAA